MDRRRAVALVTSHSYSLDIAVTFSELGFTKETDPDPGCYKIVVPRPTIKKLKTAAAKNLGDCFENYP